MIRKENKDSEKRRRECRKEKEGRKSKRTQKINKQYNRHTKEVKTKY